MGAGWLLALAPECAPARAAPVPRDRLVAATVLYLLASATQGDSNAPLAIPFFAYSVAVTRPVRVSATIVGLPLPSRCPPPRSTDPVSPIR